MTGPPPARAGERVVLSLGSNLGDRWGQLSKALARLREAMPDLRVSPVYETAPVGPDQRDFLNVVVVGHPAADTNLPALVERLEAAAGRVRTVRWGPRTLDVDVVAVGDRRSDHPALTLPHPRAGERAFVLRPWADLEPDAVLPGLGPIADLLPGLDRQRVEPWPGAGQADASDPPGSADSAPRQPPNAVQAGSA